MLKADFTHIQKVCRVEDRHVVVKYEDNVFHESVRYADPEFLQMFTFPLKWGTSGSLRDINSIILSEKMAIKYFGEENPVGRDILVKFDEATSKIFKITGVAAAFPVARTIDFGFLINFENVRTSGAHYDFDDWKEFVNATFIQVADPTDLASIQQGMEKYKALQNKAVENDWAITSFGFESLATLHERASGIKDDISRSSDSNYVTVKFLLVIGAFMLLLACFNYINIAIVSAAKRLKELGVRKTIGATRRVIIVQFLTENIVITFFALIVGLIIAGTFFIPGFESLWHFDMGFTLKDPNLWIYLPAILLLTGIASGSYPAFYISRVNVIGILKGSVKFGTKNPITKVFLCIQLILACIFITGAATFNLNTKYLANRSWGYDRAEVLYVPVPDQVAFEKLNAMVAQNSNVLSISGSAHHLGKNHTTTVMRLPGRQFEVDQLSVDANYFETMELQLTAGRVFKNHYESDKKTVVVNELIAESFGMENPVGQVFKIDSIQYEIIGVLKEFHNYSFNQKVKPTIFRVAERENYRYLSMKVRAGSELETYKDVQAAWAQLYPETPFAGGYQEDVWGSYYESLDIYALVWDTFAFIAITLASLGLYGLVTLNVAGRVKEFSIRKILGAGLPSIVGSVTGPYVLLFVLALSIGGPVGYLVMDKLMDFAFSYHLPMTFSIAGVSVGILLLVLFTTIFSQVRNVLKSNPVNGLKVE